MSRIGDWLHELARARVFQQTALVGAWPAIHRVLVAARVLARDEWDMPMPACTGELIEALRALDGGA